MAEVFISHSSKDKEIADMVCNALESNGIKCWIAPRNIVAGADWSTSIINAISESKVFIVIFSENSAKSSQVPRELALADDNSLHSRVIIPYKIDDTELSAGFKYYLTTSHWVNADVKSENYKIGELVSAVNRFLGRDGAEITVNSVKKNNNSTLTKDKKSDAVKNIVIISGIAVAVILAVIIIIGIAGGQNGTTSSQSQEDIMSNQPSTTESTSQTEESSQATTESVTQTEESSPETTTVPSTQNKDQTQSDSQNPPMDRYVLPDNIVKYFEMTCEELFENNVPYTQDEKAGYAGYSAYYVDGMTLLYAYNGGYGTGQLCSLSCPLNMVLPELSNDTDYRSLLSYIQNTYPYDCTIDYYNDGENSTATIGIRSGFYKVTFGSLPYYGSFLDADLDKEVLTVGVRNILNIDMRV